MFPVEHLHIFLLFPFLFSREGPAETQESTRPSRGTGKGESAIPAPGQIKLQATSYKLHGLMVISVARKKKALLMRPGLSQEQLRYTHCSKKVGTLPIGAQHGHPPSRGKTSAPISSPAKPRFPVGLFAKVCEPSSCTVHIYVSMHVLCVCIYCMLVCTYLGRVTSNPS